MAKMVSHDSPISPPNKSDFNDKLTISYLKILPKSQGVIKLYWTILTRREWTHKIHHISKGIYKSRELYIVYSSYVVTEILIDTLHSILML